jgi:uncharacterized protein YecE (DUF72 family)
MGHWYRAGLRRIRKSGCDLENRVQGGMAEIRLGTSAFTVSGWDGSFYPAGLKPAEYLSYYAQHFNTLEVDSTFYRIPSLSTVRGWHAKTPFGFIFSAKVPQTITHERVLVDCDGDLWKFLATMDCLGEKLGPLLFQFGYFNKKAFASVDGFLGRLVPFLRRLPKGYRFAVEVRNKNWLGAPLMTALRDHGVALALVDHAWMPRPSELLRRTDLVTADFSYVRWLGDRKGIEEKTKTWDKVIVDRQRELREWVNVVYKIDGQGIPVFAFANNHYAGHAPATVELFRELWKQQTKSDLHPNLGAETKSLFS